MALSDEQNAMLRLLAQGEQGYADIAALMGLGEDEVRAKVVGALAQLQAEGKPAPDVPPPIPGGAKPAAEAAPPEPEPATQAPPAGAEPAEPAVADTVAPKAGPAERGNESQADPAASSPTPSSSEPSPSTPSSSGPSPPTQSSPTPSSSASGDPRPGRTITLPAGRSAWLLGGGILAAIVVIVVVILLATGGGDGGSSTAPTQPGARSAEEGAAAEATAASKTPTEAVLKPVDGSQAEGRATFGRVKNKLALQVEAKGLEPTTEGNSYTVWLAQSPQKMLPLASTAVRASGKGAHEIAAQFEVPVEILAYLAQGTFDQIAITKTDNERFVAAVKAAKKRKAAPSYTGEEVLRGTITGPIVGLALREEEAKEAEEGG